MWVEQPERHWDRWDRRDRRGHGGGPGPLFGLVAPFVLAFFQVVGTLGAAHGQPDATELDALAIALLVAGPLALIGLRANPRLVLAVVSGVTFLYLVRGYAFGPVFVAFAAAVVVNIALGHRVAAWLCLGLAVVLAGFVRARTLDEGWSAGALFGGVAWALVVGAIGEVVRGRRARAMETYRARREMARRQAGEERLQIARELHDVVAHHMSLINVQAGVALHLVDRQPDQVITALTTIKDASKEALTELRSLIGVLRADGEAAPRMPVTTLAALPGLVSRTAQAGVTVQTEVTGDPSAIPAAVEVAAFRIVQEAITNVVRHSGASSATIAVSVGEDALEVRVQDDGRGIAADLAEVEGAGVRGMRERAAAFGGTVHVGTAPSGGTLVHARLPMGGAR